jgi:hypothetical protein
MENLMKIWLMNWMMRKFPKKKKKKFPRNRKKKMMKKKSQMMKKDNQYFQKLTKMKNRRVFYPTYPTD